jgi:hypothetical protein
MSSMAIATANSIALRNMIIRIRNQEKTNKQNDKKKKNEKKREKKRK